MIYTNKYLTPETNPPLTISFASTVISPPAFLAAHLYVAVSSRYVSAMNSFATLPSNVCLKSSSSEGMESSSLYQCIEGRSRADMEHSKEASSPSVTVKSVKDDSKTGGRTISRLVDCRATTKRSHG